MSVHPCKSCWSWESAVHSTISYPPCCHRLAEAQQGESSYMQRRILDPHGTSEETYALQVEASHDKQVYHLVIAACWQPLKAPMICAWRVACTASLSRFGASWDLICSRSRVIERSMSGRTVVNMRSAECPLFSKAVCSMGAQVQRHKRQCRMVLLVACLAVLVAAVLLLLYAYATYRRGPLLGSSSRTSTSQQAETTMLASAAGRKLLWTAAVLGRRHPRNALQAV